MIIVRKNTHFYLFIGNTNDSITVRMGENLFIFVIKWQSVKILVFFDTLSTNNYLSPFQFNNFAF
jgi:hypothetical protein